MHHGRKFLFSKLARDGFTLLEVMIAVAIMTISLGAILQVQSNSLKNLDRSKIMGTAAMLARNQMIQAEMVFQGKSFEEIPGSEEGKFDAPFEEYRWAREIKEIEFPEMNFSGGGESSEGEESQGNEMAERIGKIFSNYMTKGIREVVVTIYHGSGDQEREYQVSTYWVNLNNEFNLTF